MSVTIIPGSCSSKTNWFDQIRHFSNGSEVNFLQLNIISGDVNESSEDLFLRLKKVFSKKASSPNGREVIICHSMGGMLILNILRNKEIFYRVDPVTFNRLADSFIFFTQTPLKVSPWSLVFVKSLFKIGIPILNFYNKHCFDKLDKKITAIKERLEVEHINFDRQPLNPKAWMSFLFNIFSMLNSLLGTRPQVCENLIKIYEDWDVYSKDALCKWDKELRNRKNFFFTAGSPDMFCETERIVNFAKHIGAQVKHFPVNCHNPMHLMWSQKTYHQWVEDSVSKI